MHVRVLFTGFLETVVPEHVLLTCFQFWNRTFVLPTDIIEGDNLQAILKTCQSAQISFDLHQTSLVVLIRHEVLLLGCDTMASHVDKKESWSVFVDFIFYHSVVDFF